MKLYMAPGSCSTGIHILLEEVELPFEAWIVNLPAGDHYKPEYLAINPESTIPTLVRDDGSALTEFQAIAWWLARRHPKAKLLPDDADGEARGRGIVEKGFALMNDVLAGREYVAGHFSIADAALFYTEFWADRIAIDLPENCLAHYWRMRARPVVQRMLAEEGYRWGGGDHNGGNRLAAST